MTVSMRFSEIDSPVGPMRLATDGAGLRRIDFLDGRADRRAPADWVRDDAALAGVIEQLRAYFAGALRDFTAPLAPQGTSFQQGVWRRLRDIPYGETNRYREVAMGVGKSRGVPGGGLA